MTLVRRASGADEATVRDLVQAAYEGYVEVIGRPPAPMLDDYASLIVAGHVWVTDGGVIVMWAKPGHWYVDNIAVDPDRQGSGIGARLLGHADLVAGANGFDEIRLYTNAAMEANLTFYPRRGFTETHRDTEAGYDRVYFRRPVPVVARPVDLGDRAVVESVAELRHRWSAEPDAAGTSGVAESGPTAQFVDRLEAWFDREAERRTIWLAWTAGEPVGMINLTGFDRMPKPDAEDSSWGYVGNAYVVPELRGRGIGAVLARAVIERACREGLVRLVLNPSDRSRAFWHRHGFEARAGLLALEPPT